MRHLKPSRERSAHYNPVTNKVTVMWASWAHVLLRNSHKLIHNIAGQSKMLRYYWLEYSSHGKSLCVWGNQVLLHLMHLDLIDLEGTFILYDLQ